MYMCECVSLYPFLTHDTRRRCGMGHHWSGFGEGGEGSGCRANVLCFDFSVAVVLKRSVVDGACRGQQQDTAGVGGVVCRVVRHHTVAICTVLLWLLTQKRRRFHFRCCSCSGVGVVVARGGADRGRDRDRGGRRSSSRESGCEHGGGSWLGHFSGIVW